eukprot:TRINITY_DN5829_c0_g1_i9.p1 TRINITY_DN5829_c0_g1~~TRINITY_DN5829_c0_g1_i9.p1  ORF type:complete len:598 (-),score=84.23 TRINITY_DN5829_c0_g1_i9:579-2372(-)
MDRLSAHESDLPFTCCHDVQLFGRGMDDDGSTRLSAKWFRPYSVWFSVCSVALALIIAAFLISYAIFGQIFWASLHYYPSSTIRTPFANSLTLTHENHYIRATLRPHTNLVPISFRIFHRSRGFSFTQSFGIASANYSILERNSLFPFGSGSSECPSLSAGSMPYGSYGMELFYEPEFRLRVEDSEASVDPRPCDPLFEHSRLRLVNVNDTDVSETVMEDEIIEITIWHGISMFMYRMGTAKIGWVFYFTIAISIMSQYFMMGIFRQSKPFRWFCWIHIIFLLGMTICYGTTLPSLASLPLFVITLLLMVVPFIGFAYLTIRLVRQRRSMDLIEYSSAGRFDVFVRQMREIGFRTETQIREIMRPKRHSANQGSVYKFYCPICMLYYSDILKTDCCDQYICLDCVLSFLKGKGALSPDAEVLPFDLPLVSCLYCTKEPFMLSHPKRSDTAKDYGDGSKSPRLRSESKTAPLKIGDSFDTMKEKMILFESISKPADANELSPKTEVKRYDLFRFHHLPCFSSTCFSLCCLHVMSSSPCLSCVPPLISITPERLFFFLEIPFYFHRNPSTTLANVFLVGYSLFLTSFRFISQTRPMMTV